MKRQADKGKIILEEGKYFLDIDGKKQELPAGTIDEAKLKELAGKEVEIIYSEPQSFVVGIKADKTIILNCFIFPWPPKPPCYVPCYIWDPRPPWPPCYIHCFVCYLPADWLIKGVEVEVRKNLAQRFLDEGIISKENYEKFIG